MKKSTKINVSFLGSLLFGCSGVVCGEGAFSVGVRCYRSGAEIPLPESVVDIATGDLDQDGRQDLAILTATELTLLFQSADGIFQSQSIALEDEGTALLLEDFNNDGRLDLIIGTSDAQSSGALLVALGHGCGQRSRFCPAREQDKGQARGRGDEDLNRSLLQQWARTPLVNRLCVG